MKEIIVNVKEFSITPGSRYRDEGEKAHSGQEFREVFLEPLFEDKDNDSSIIIVNLDGTIGYGTSWLEEVFGGLARKYGNDLVYSKIHLISNEEPYLIDDIKEYIKNA
ncbi:hypothetical protein Q762_15035 [Flavobacterium cauense R2A-7]|nr:STAS-like domain-containing protein [Flavobacterium cauense]KGO78681.1 hypothetical protein Q762_15035 [Flavobacterium cauense R2A-7]